MSKGISTGYAWPASLCEPLTNNGYPASSWIGMETRIRPGAFPRSKGCDFSLVWKWTNCQLLIVRESKSEIRDFFYRSAVSRVRLIIFVIYLFKFLHYYRAYRPPRQECQWTVFHWRIGDIPEKVYRYTTYRFLKVGDWAAIHEVVDNSDAVTPQVALDRHLLKKVARFDAGNWWGVRGFFLTKLALGNNIIALSLLPFIFQVICFQVDLRFARAYGSWIQA